MSPRATRPAGPVDPYGQPIVFDGTHALPGDHAGERIPSVPRPTPEEIARAASLRSLDKLGARYGVPLVLILGIVSQLLDEL